jgi:Rhs element Vgr protein
VSTFTVTIKSDGQPLAEPYRLLALDVSREVDRIPAASLALIDGTPAGREYPLGESGLFAPGKEIEILARYEGEDDVTLFKGPAVGNGLRAGDAGLFLDVELRDAAVKLTRTRRSRAFRELSDADIFSQLVGGAGLQAGEVADTQTVHPELIQFRVSDWDFLVSRAQAFGLVVVADDGTLSLLEPDPSRTAEERLEFGIDEIFDLELAVAGLDQESGIAGSTWDPAAQAASAEATAEPFALAQGDQDPARIAEAIGFTPQSLAGAAPLVSEELQGWLDGSLRRNRLALIRGRIGIRGSPGLRPLQTIEIAGVGSRFEGTALVTGVRHRIDEGGWRTDIQLGLPPERLVDRVEIQERPAGGLLPSVPGLQIGVVDAFEADPDDNQRVRVLLPVLGEEPGAVWARLATPHGGAEHGLIFRPEVDDEVVVGFLNGDPRQAVILGSLFSSAQPPPGDYASADQDNFQKGIVTRSGTRIGFVDDDSATSVFIETPAGNKVLLDDANGAIEISDQNDNRLVLDASGIQISSAGDVAIDASGAIQINGASIDMN